MPSRREQIQSYQYLMQRVVNAFVVGETDPAQPPLRRLAGAGYASIMVAALALAAVGVYGLVKHGGNTSWRNERVVIIEKESGTRYVYRGGLLYPVANYVSALLVLGGPGETVSVSRESLLGAARGPLIGITGAPDALPPTGRLLSGQWSTCAQATQDNPDAADAVSWLRVGLAPVGGRSLGTGGLLVRDVASKRIYLVWNGHRFLVPSPSLGVLSALGIDQQPIGKVDAGWLDALPSGPAVAPVAVDNRGRPSTALPGALIGQVFAVTSADKMRYYLARAGDLLPITAVEEAVTLADQNTAAAYPGTTPTAKQISAGQVAGATLATRADRTDASLPEQPPVMATVDTGAAVCAVYRDVHSPADIVYNAGRLGATEGIATNGSPTAAVVDRVVVPAGHAAIVASVGSADSPLTEFSLVTDQGRRYPIPDPAELAWLGYSPAKAVTLPSWVLLRLPAGPALDPTVAARPVPTS